MTPNKKFFVYPTLLKDTNLFIYLGCILFIYCYYNGVIFHPDSQSYINQAEIRMGLYPLSISLFQFLFNEYALTLLTYFQLLLILVSTYFMTSFLKKVFKLPTILYWFCTFIFLMPIIIFNTANEILSEGISYPLFIITTLFFLKGVLLKDSKYLYYFTLSTFLLTFTRQQYIFYYVVAVAALLYFAILQPQYQKKLQYFLSISLSILSFVLAEKTYHYIYHGSFASTPFTGIEILIRPLYLSTEDTYKDFNNPKQQQFVKEAIDTILNQKLMDVNPSKRELNGFGLQINAMRYQISYPLLKDVWSKEYLENTSGKALSEFEYLQLIDKQATSIALVLIKNNFFNYIKAYGKDTIRGFGGYAYFFFILVVSLCFIWMLLLTSTSSAFNLAFLFSAMIHLGNIMIVCLCEPPLIRYTYSTSILVFCMLIIMVYLYSNQPSYFKAKTCVE